MFGKRKEEDLIKDYSYSYLVLAIFDETNDSSNLCEHAFTVH